MPYPMRPWPTLKQFIEKAEQEFGATVETSPTIPVGPRGPAPIKYLRRDARFAVLPNIADHEVVQPSVLRSLCNQLGIPLHTFDLPFREAAQPPPTRPYGARRPWEGSLRSSWRGSRFRVWNLVEGGEVEGMERTP